MALATRTVTATYVHADGVTPCSGTVTFTPNTALASALDDRLLPARPIRRTLDADGGLSVPLVCTDDDAVSPSGWAYNVVEQLPGARREYVIAVPAGAVPLDLADVVPLETVPPVAQYVRLDQVPLNDRGVLAPATGYDRWDVVTYRGRRVLVVEPLTSGAGGISNDLAESAILDLAGQTVIAAHSYGFRTDGNPASAAANRAALQAALDDAAVLQAAQVVLPPGFAFITGPTVEVPSRVMLRGAGQFSTTLQLAPGSNCHMLRVHTSTNGTTDRNAVWCSIADLTLDGRATTQTGPGPYHGLVLVTNPLTTAASSDQAHDPSHLISAVHVRNTLDDGIRIEGRSDIRLIGCKVSHAGGDAFRLSFDTHAIGCVAEKPARAGFRVTGSATQLVSCKSYLAGQGAQGAARPPVPAEGHGYVIEGNGIGEVALAGCDAQQVSGHGFYLGPGVEAVTLAGVTVAESSFGQGGAYAAIALAGASRCVITATSRHNTGVPAVSLTGGADRNSIDIGHAPRAGQTPSPVVAPGSALLANRIVGNAAPIAVRQAWAPSTAYVTGQEVTYYGSVYRVTSDHTSPATFALSNLALLSAPLAANPIPPGKTIFPSGGSAPGTGQTGNGTMRGFPWYVPHDTPLTRIGCEVTAAGNAGSVIRLMIYADTGEIQPGPLLLDAGTVPGDIVGVQEITIAQALAAGVYWLSAVVQSATTQPTLRTAGQGAYALPITGTPGPGVVASGYTHGVAVPGAAPATFSPGGVVGVIPRIHVRS
ncbi:carbohydrate-binding protein [Actinomadura hibisca]|uniref:carbohydrate-binding protein n=1 Tax=Actinomadura hibisca TaxID=68565 RepID=UPI0008339983|nr:carbohydrate-binding protein [Actinomadura hibisca]